MKLFLQNFGISHVWLVIKSIACLAEINIMENHSVLLLLEMKLQRVQNNAENVIDIGSKLQAVIM